MWGGLKISSPNSLSQSLLSNTAAATAQRVIKYHWRLLVSGDRIQEAFGGLISDWLHYMTFPSRVAVSCPQIQCSHLVSNMQDIAIIRMIILLMVTLIVLLEQNMDYTTNSN